MKKLLLILLLAFPLSANAFYYVAPETITPDMLPTPNKSDDDLNKSELAEIRKIQSESDAEIIKRAISEQINRPDIITKALGEEYSRINQPYLYGLLDRVGSDCEEITHNAKAYWKTDRPYLVDKQIKLQVRSLSNNSYPSGHTSCGYVWAEVLGQILPEKRQILRDKAKETASFRMIVGVHYPNDIRMGERLAYMIFGALQQSEAYKKDLETIRKQLK